MAQTADVLVVGLGPAGGAAALAAARAGLRVVTVDKKQAVGVPVQCAEFIPLPLSSHAPENVRQQRIAGMRTFLPSGACAHSDFPGIMVDRAAFDQALAEAARQAGATLQLASRIVELDIQRSAAQIATPQATLEIQYRLLIAADGPHSFVARALGLPPLETVNTRQYTVALKQPHADTDIWLSATYPGGYAWLFPKGQYANLGLGMDPYLDTDMKTPLDELHRQLIRAGRLGEEIYYRTGGAIPVCGLRDRLAIGNTLFAGDAAGLTHPITGAGIAAAVVSGEAAGEAAARWLLDAKASALTEYEEDMRDQFAAMLDKAVARRRWLNTQWRDTAANEDAIQRQGWIAFPEYFGDVEKSLTAKDAKENSHSLPSGSILLG